MRRILTLTAGAGAFTGVALGLNQWSSWWQHSDMRQMSGTTIQYLASSVAFIVAMRILIRWRMSDSTKSSAWLQLVAVFAVTSAISWWAVYQTAVAMTIDHN